MRKSWAHTREWLLISLLLMACLALGVLQYRWTGELSRAETARLRASAGARAQQVARAFDSELRRAVNECMPSGEDVERLGPDRANSTRLRLSYPRFERPYFRRIAAAVPGANGLEFHEADLTSYGFARGTWPDSPHWRGLRAGLEKIARGEPVRGQVVDPASVLIEVPIFGDDKELEWLLFEVDDHYATSAWIPELIREYINPENEQEFHVSVERDASAQPRNADAHAVLFPVGLLRRPGGRGDSPGRWTLDIRHVEGSIDAAVAAARRRNISVALALLALIAAASSMLVRYTARARVLSDAQFQFFAGLSHELRTPLTVIQGAAHNLLSGVVKDAPQRENYARAIVRQSSQLNEMVDQMLSFAGLRKGVSSELQPIPVSVCVSEAIEAVSHELEQAGRSVDADIPPDLPPVWANEDGLRRVLTNLIGNAIRHGGGEVSVSAIHREEFAEVLVSDSGGGIPPEEIRRIFDPFFRGERARAGRVRGTGLGLSLVKETVESYGGSVTVESSTGKGAAFTLRLRVAS